MAYITAAEGDTYFASKLFAAAWTESEDGDRTKAIAMATATIDRLNFRGLRTATTQANQFPRDDDTAVPQDIKDACAELAMAFLDGRDPEQEMEEANIRSQTFAGVSTRQTETPMIEHIMAGIPSYTAWQLLLPYLHDVRNIEFERVN